MSTASEERPTPWIARDSDSFGARLALVRQRMGWGNVKEAALACGLPVESWRGWERDNASPRNLIDACRKIAARTGCDVHWLAGLPRMDSNHQPPGLRRVTGYSPTRTLSTVA